MAHVSGSSTTVRRRVQWDKDKLLSRHRQHGVESPPVETGIDSDAWANWLKDKSVQLPTEQAVLLADVLEVELPEIDVADFEKGGYLPEVLLNYLLLGYSPADGREQFDGAFICDNFDPDRIVKSPHIKFDRDKLLAFNLDALQAMVEDEFVSRPGNGASCITPNTAGISMRPPSIISPEQTRNDARASSIQ